MLQGPGDPKFVRRAAFLLLISAIEAPEPVIREMLIPPIQSKWDVSPKTVLGPSRPPVTYLRNADGRADNIKP
jgi:hypothetical protein